MKRYDVIPEQFKNRWFWIYILSMSVVFFSQELGVSKQYKVVTFLILFLSQLVYNIKVKHDNWFDIVKWILLILIGVTILISISSILREYNIVYALITLMILLVLSSLTSFYVVLIWKAKDSTIESVEFHVFLIWILYVLLSVSVITLFTFLFSVASFFPNHDVEMIDSTKEMGAIDYFYYSGGVYYSSPFGDMKTNGLSKMLTLAEYSFSSIVHIVLLGIAVNAISKRKDKV